MTGENQMKDDSSTPIWAERIINLLEEQGMTQKELAEKSGTSTASISDWIGGKSKREPKVKGFLAVAKALGVSTDYLLGANECKTPTNEEIHKIIGLSDKAIEGLIHLQADGRGISQMKLAACNYLLEAMGNSQLFENLYRYLLGEYCFQQNGTDLGAMFIYAKGPTGEDGEVLNFAENYSRVYLSKVLEDLAIMRRAQDEVKKAKDRAEYERWKQSDEGKAFERENLELQAAYEEAEEQK